MEAGGAEASIAGMLGQAVVFIPSVTVVAVVRFVEEGPVGSAPVVVVVVQNEENVVGAVRVASEGDHVGRSQGENFDLVVGEDGLKGGEFLASARAFGHAGALVEGFGQACLGGIAAAEGIVRNLGPETPLFVAVGFEGDNGAGATQGVGVANANATAFDDAA